MRDNPANVRAFAISDAERRRQALERFFRPVLLGTYHQRGLIYGAYRDSALVGSPAAFTARLLSAYSSLKSSACYPQLYSAIHSARRFAF